LSAAEDGLSVQAERDLYDAVCQAYDENSFKQLLRFHCERRGQEVLASGRGFKDNVFAVFEKATAEGWMRTVFIPAVLVDREDHEKVRQWARRHNSDSPWPGSGAGASGRPRSRDPLSALHFDMKAIRASIRNSLAGAPLGVFGFGLKSRELWFTEMVRDLFVDRLHAQYKKPLTLNPMVSHIGRQVAEVVMYRRALERDSVLCVVDVYGVSENSICDFWEQVAAALGGINRYLILLFVGSDSTEFPAGIIELPQPTFDDDDVADFVEATVRRIPWPDSLAGPWQKTLIDYANQDGQLNVRMFYEELDRTINDVQFDRDKFRKELEGKVIP
jgi:hypothetical protein